MTTRRMSGFESSTSPLEDQTPCTDERHSQSANTAVLHVISDRQRHQLPLVEALVAAAKGGADVIQIREKKAPASETFELIQQLHAAFADLEGADRTTRLFVNDRVDVAIATYLPGVHLAAKSLPLPVVSSLRKRLQWNGLIGCSVHALDEAKQAEAMGADYVTFGHIFASASHPTLQPRGLQALGRVVEALAIPVIAIGGIDRLNIGPVLETGCAGVAVIGSVLDAPDPEAATRTLKRLMQQSSARPKVPFWPPRGN